MAESLYTTQTPDPGSTDLADLTGGGSTATTVKFSVAGEVTGGRFFAPATTGGATFTFELWELTSDVAGTLLASKAYAGVSGSAWNTVALDTPVTVVTNKVYRVATHNSAGRYVAAAALFSAPLTNGSITGIQAGTTHTGASGDLFNGTFQIGAAGTLPGSHFGSPSYLADLLFDPTGVTGALVGSLPALTASLAGSLSIPGTLAGTLPALTASVAGLVFNPGDGEGLSIAAVMAEIAARLETIVGLRVYAWPPGSLTPPAAVVSYPDEITFDQTYGRGMDRMAISVVVVVGKATARTTPAALGQYAKGAGLKSVKQILESADYSSFHTLRVERVVFDAVTIGGVEYMAALFDIDITGAGD